MNKVGIGAVDIGGTKIAAGIIGLDGRILAQRECPTQPEAGFENAMGRVEAMLRTCLEEAETSCLGIGIGCTGPVDPFSGLIGNVDFLPGWEEKNPVELLSRFFGLQVAMENDADASALGECRWGLGKGKGTVLCVTVGTGIGGGLVVDGRLFRGVAGSHPEIGHHVVDPSGPLCFCGADGCWEVLAAGPAMEAWAKANAPMDHPHLQDLSAKRLCELALAEDPLAQRAVAREAHYLGLGIANLVTLFAPDRIVLGGSVMRSAPLFLPGIQARVARNCGLVPHEKTEIALASLGPDAGLIGAAAVWLHRFPGLGD
jgi:glucokinase